jgi:hypothetical protein
MPTDAPHNRGESGGTMSTLAAPQRASEPISWIKVAALTAGLAVIAFVLSPNAPLGGFWRPDAHMPMPTPGQLPHLLMINLAEVIAFGLGVSFLVFGYPLVRAIAPSSPLLTRAVHLSITWLMVSWWPHDSLHIHNGMNLNGLIVIEYVFHVTLMAAGVILAYFFLSLQPRTLA